MSVSPEVVSAVASCLNATTAACGLIGLAFYVTYTKRMMLATEDALRASIRPIVLVKEVGYSAINRRAVWEFSNIGNGTAVMVAFWDVSTPPEPGAFAPEPTSEDVEWIDMLEKGGKTEYYNIKTPEAGSLGDNIIISYEDQAGNQYQTHVSYSRSDEPASKGSMMFFFAERSKRRKLA